MEAIELLKKYKNRVDEFLKSYFKDKKKQVSGIDPIAEQAVEIIADFTLSGGKRIRPALVYYGYLASGGKDEEKIIEASASMELIHSFLLIHDDIIDRDEKRHGIKTVHEKYKEIGKRFSISENLDHFGNSMAIVAGDMAYAMGNEIMFGSKFSPAVIVEALDKLQNIVYNTIPGEMLDVIMENRGYASEKEILHMFEGKTSRYTFEGPLHLGCVLAQENPGLFKPFSEYSLPLGKAFQIQDDILGVFGNEKKLGKPIGSDVAEGKQTILLIKAIEKGGREEKKKIKELLGKSDLTSWELEEFREIIRKTGSLEYSQKLAKDFVRKSLEALKTAKIKNKEALLFLEGLAEYIVNREV